MFLKTHSNIFVQRRIPTNSKVNGKVPNSFHFYGCPLLFIVMLFLSHSFAHQIHLMLARVHFGFSSCVLRNTNTPKKKTEQKQKKEHQTQENSMLIAKAFIQIIYADLK